MGQHRDDFPPAYLERIDACRTLSAMDVARDQVIRSEVYDAIQGVLATHEILVSPTLAAMPVDNATNGDTKGPTHVEGVEVDPLIGWCLTYLMNFSGQPSASVPAGLSDGLPVGIHLIGRRYADGDVLAAAAAVEGTRPWSDAYRICRERPLRQFFRRSLSGGVDPPLAFESVGIGDAEIDERLWRSAAEPDNALGRNKLERPLDHEILARRRRLEPK
jgi:hypothetical protein